MLDFLKESQNEKSLYIEIDGPKHFLNGNFHNRKGGSIIKREYLHEVNIN